VWQPGRLNIRMHLTRWNKCISCPVLKLYRRGREHVLQTDACREQIAATLLQREEDRELHPVMYASRKLLPREVRYAIPDKEGLAVFWALNNFYKYLFVSRFVIQTDCQALTILNGNPRILRWQICKALTTPFTTLEEQIMAWQISWVGVV